MLQLLDLNKNKIAGLTEYKDLCIESVLKTGDKTLSFLYSNKSKHYFKIVEEAYIRTKQDEFVIKEINVESEFTTFICKLNVEELEGKTFDRFESKEQTITAALNLAIVGTGWTVQDNNIKKKRTIRKTNCSSWEIIQDIKNTYRVDIEFDSLNKKIKIHESLGLDKGAYFIDSLNLKSINIQSNSYDFYTRMIPVGKDGMTIESVNNGKNYVENYQYSNKVKTIYWKDERYTIKENLKDDAIAKLKEISKPYKAYSVEILNLARLNDKYKDVLDYHLGDTITLISKDNNIKEKQRIVKTKIYPEDHFKDSCELSNTILSFEDIQTQFEEAAETIDNVTTDNGTIDGSTVDSIEVKQIEDFEANVIKVSKLKAILAEIESLHTNKADIQNLNAIVAKIGTLEATKASITELNSIHAIIQQIKAGKADINELNVAVERVGILEGKTLSVENQLAGNLTAKNFKANSITAGSGIIAEGAIGTAQISSLSVNKLEAGDITTSKHKIVSADGTIEIVGNQILINRNNVNRVILGEYRKQDNTTDYGLLIRAKDGKTIMLDGEGVHNAGITDGAIDNNKVADNANISGNKLDINSVIREVNNKGTETIKGTKVTVGDRTLDVELSTQKNTITEHGKELSNQKATINALDNAIKLKVDNQTFTQSTSTINNNINNLNSDLVSKINSSLNNAKSYADSKKQEAINSSNSHADAKANESLNNAKAYTNAQVNTVNNNLSKATSEINILKNQISTKVGQVDIDRSIQEIKIGGRNYAIGTSSDWIIIDGKNSENQCTNIANLVQDNVINKEITISFEFEVSQGSRGMFVLQTSGSYWATLSSRPDVFNTPNGKLVRTMSIPYPGAPNKIQFAQIRMDNFIGQLKIRKLMIEEGTKNTDYVPAPEDTSKAIIDSTKVVTDKINDVSTKLTQTKDSLQASVNSLNSTTQTITTNLTNTTNNLNNKINRIQIDCRNLLIRKNESKNMAFNWNTTGIPGNCNGQSVSDFISVIPGETYWWSIWTNTSTLNDIYWYDFNKNYIGQKWGNGYPTGERHNSFVVPNNARYCRLNYMTSVKEIKFEKGSKYTGYSEAPEDIENNINNSLNNAKAYTNAQITTVNTRVSNAESNINVLKNQISTKVSQSDIDKTVNNIQIGGRNLLRDTKNISSNFWKRTETVDRNINYGGCAIQVQTNDWWYASQYYQYIPNKTYTFSCMCRADKLGANIYASPHISHICGKSMEVPLEWTKFSYTFTTNNKQFANNGAIEQGARFECSNLNGKGNKVYITQIKLEEGNKPTDWTPAPEDIGQELKDNITTVTEKINTVESTLTQKTNNINAAVSSVQSILNTKADGSTVSSIQSQLASLNIGVDGIRAEVAKKTDKDNIISAINQSAEEIKIDASRIKINGLTTFASKTGLKAIEIESNNILFYDWEGSERKEPVGKLYSTRSNGDVNKPGLAIGHEENSMFDIVYKQGDTYISYIGFDKYKAACPITLFEDINLNGCLMYLSSKKINSIYESTSDTFCIETKHGLNIFDKDSKATIANLGSSRVGFSKWDQKYYYAEFFPDGFSLGNGRGKSYFWVKADESTIWTAGGVSMGIQGNLTVSGKKNRVVETSIGNLALNALESTECWFTDCRIEQDRTDANGDCIIWFDSKFLLTVNTRYRYKIDVTPIGEFASNGKLTYVRVVEKTEKYFKVRGTPNTLFDWTITAKQVGYERDRLEKVEKAS